MSNISYLRPFAFETLSPTDVSVVSCTESTFTQLINNQSAQPAREASISVMDNPIRFRIDGTDPDQTTGHYLPVGSYFSLTSATAIKNFRAITIGTTVTAKLSVTYFNG